MRKGLAIAAGMAGLCLALAGCQTLVQPATPLAYDVRDVAIVAPGTVSPRAMAALDRALTDSVRATRRPVPLPRVVVLVTLEDRIASETGPLSFSRSTVTVSATSVDSGEDIAVGRFAVLGRGFSQAAAEEDAMRQVADAVQSSFGLTAAAAPPARSRPVPALLTGWI